MIPSSPRNLQSYVRSPPGTPTHQGATRGTRVSRGLQESFASFTAASPAPSNTRFAGLASSKATATPPNSPKPGAAPPTTPRAYNPVPTAATPQTPSSTSLLDVDEEDPAENGDEDDDDVFNILPGPAHQSQYPVAGWFKRPESERIKLILKWALATEDDGREDYEIAKVHRDYWIATKARQNARDLAVKMMFGLARFCERVGDLAVKVHVALPETKPEFHGGPCFPSHVTVKTFESRYTSGANPEARFASELANEVFLHSIAVPHAAKFLVRKRHLMKSLTLRMATPRPVPNAIESWRFVAAPVVPALAGIAEVQDIMAESVNRADERKRWIARHDGHSPTLPNVVEYLKANNVSIATRDAVLDMLVSPDRQHHPADDWYHIFTKRYGLSVDVAVGLFVVAVDDATAEGWPF